MPSFFTKKVLILPVSFDISIEFFEPKFLACGRPLTTWAVMAVPKTPVDEHYCSPTRKDNVRYAGQITPMQTEAITQAIKRFAYDNLRRRVLVFNTRHVPTALLRGYPFAHNEESSSSTQPATAWPSKGGTAFPI